MNIETAPEAKKETIDDIIDTTTTNLTELKEAVDHDQYSPKSQKIIDRLTEQAQKKEKEQTNNPKNTQRSEISKKLSSWDIIWALSWLFNYYFKGNNRTKSWIWSGLMFYWNAISLTEKDTQKLKKQIKKEPSLYAKYNLCEYLSKQLDLNAEKEKWKKMDLNEHLQYQIKQKTFWMWDIILFDSVSKWMFGRAKDELLKKWTYYTHTWIITQLSPLKMTHAIWSWVKEILVSEYTDKHSHNNIVITNGWWKVAAEKAKSNIWKPYDSIWMRTDYWDSKTSSDNSAFYCSELVLNAIDSKNKSLITPDDLLKITSPLYIKETN